MIDNLYDLSETVTKVANYIAVFGAESSTDGTLAIDFDDLCGLIAKEDLHKYYNLIVTELSESPVFEEVTCRWEGSELILECTMDPHYCPFYEWQEGDERIFGFGREEWENNYVCPGVPLRMSMARYSEIGAAAIDDALDNLDNAVEHLTESLGMSMDELETNLGIFKDPDADIEKSDSCDPSKPQNYFAEFAERYGESVLPPIKFYAWDEHAADIHAEPFLTFEEALQSYWNLRGKEHNLSFLAFEKNGRAHGGILIQSDDLGERWCAISEEAMAKNPHISLAHAKAKLYCVPGDTEAFSRLCDAEAALGIRDRAWNPPLDNRIASATPKNTHIPTSKAKTEKEK